MKRKGSSLHDGAAHINDHQCWSRRDFLAAIGATAGSALMMGTTPIRPMAGPIYRELMGMDSERVLVLIQLDGGNDGLNTVIPFDNDIYRQVRPNVAIPRSQVLQLNNELGFHPSMDALMSMYNEGQMAILQGVGYPEQDLSHFRSTDIWMSASEADTYLNTGWIGRSMQVQAGDIASLPYPLAVQLGWGSPLLLKGDNRSVGMAVTNTDMFNRLADSGKVYDESAVNTTAAGSEISFVRSVANDAFRYAGAIQAAANQGQNAVQYPDNFLAENLAIVARLIKGNLGARIYHVILDGFDTHADQPDWHATLLMYLAQSVAAFQQDIAASGWQDRVLTMTFSEFGRRVEENGSRGTDHGTAAPLFLFGPTVRGGFYGDHPDLATLDTYGNLHTNFNFRNVYSTVLQDWFGFSPSAAAGVIGASYASLGFVASPISTSTDQPLPEASFTLHANYPNPFAQQTNIVFTLPKTTSLRINVFDTQGRLVQRVFDGVKTPGRHELSFTAANLPSGRYFCRIDTEDGNAQSIAMTLLR